MTDPGTEQSRQRRPKTLGVILLLAVAVAVVAYLTGIRWWSHDTGSPAFVARHNAATLRDCQRLLSQCAGINPTAVNAVASLLATDRGNLAREKSWPIALMVVTYRERQGVALEVVVHLVADPMAAAITVLTDEGYVHSLLGDDWFAWGNHLLGLLFAPGRYLGTPSDVERQERVMRATLDGDLTFLREQTVEPLHVVAVIPRADEFVPTSLRGRAQSVIVNIELNLLEWRSDAAFVAENAEVATQLARIVAAWREIALSMKSTSGRQHPTLSPVTDTLQASSILTSNNQVHTSIAVRTPMAFHVARRAAGQISLLTARYQEAHPPVPPKTDDAVAREVWRLESAQAVTDLLKPDSELPGTVLPDSPSATKNSKTATAPRSIAEWRGLLTNSNSRVRAAAVWSLARLGGREVLPDVVMVARRDPSEHVRFRALWGLSAIGDKAALPAVIEALGDENRAVRERGALIALRTLADDTVSDRLLKMTAHPRDETRRLVMFLLPRYGGLQSMPALKQGLQDRSPLVRAEAARAVGRLNARETLSALLPLLQESDEHVRGAAAFAAGRSAEPAAIGAIRPLVKDRDAWVRAMAAEALQRLGDPEVKPPPGFAGENLFTFPLYDAERGNW